MYRGIPARGIEFYNLLFESNEFCVQLGKVALAAGKLEAELIKKLRRKGVTENLERATLGRLIKIAQKGNYIDQNMFIALDMVCKQRNYITHNIYALFIDLIEESILDSEGLLDSDVQTYIEKAWQLQENLNRLARQVGKK